MLKRNMIQNMSGKADCLDPQMRNRRQKKSKHIIKKVSHSLKRREERFWKKDQQPS